jgi:hypothetical protein
LWRFTVCLLGAAVAARAETIIIDNAPAAGSPHRFSTDGTWIPLAGAPGCFGSDYVVAAGPGATTEARFQPAIKEAGVYRIYVRWPEANPRAERGPRSERLSVEIALQGGARTDTTRRLNQRLNGGVWVFLGSYYLAAGTGNSVRLRAPGSGVVVADAVRFELSHLAPTPPSADAPPAPRAEYHHDDPRLNPVETLVVRTDSGLEGVEPRFELRCAGVPFVLKGACGVEAIPEIAAAGGNAVRSYSAALPAMDDAVLKQASDHGVRVIVGLAMAKPTGGFYQDAARVAAQFAALSAQIDRWKHYAAVLAWGIGNEIDPVTLSADDARPVYLAIEQLARYARNHDHYHPTVSVHAGSSQEKIRRIRALAPTIDIVACNSYAHVGNVAGNVAAAGWIGPYLVTEYSIHQPSEQKGPGGITPWGAIIEPLSRAKAERLQQVYRDDLQPHPRCLGGFVFKGARGAFRVTPTWYLLFHDEAGSLKPTPSLDAMRSAWAGPTAPHLTAPIVESITLDGRAPADGVILSGASGTATAAVTVTAPAGATLSYRVEIRPDVSIKVNTVPPPLTHVAITQDISDARKFHLRTADLAPGDYRLYYYVRRIGASAPGGYVSVGTANIPFRRL